MYADRVVAETNKRSVKERLNGDSDEEYGRGRTSFSKRQRQNDNKWKHDLYDDEDKPRVSTRRVAANDLRLKLQKKGLKKTYQKGKGSLAGGVQDLRVKLSGIAHAQQANTDLPKSKPKELAKPARKSAAIDVPMAEAKKVVNSTASRKKSQQKGDSVDGFLESLGLEKYSITFQAEEVDMTALMHMTDEDLKALGMPMGPRKKILLALDSRE
ncbi:hypothetical protein MKW98_015855 [Papaver atlanticum]|uniref:SAM domain-containing protein n=1 Tax=Papaver atlanticum TaxID=357466 RepID=A0AAD4T402_9MAGN|nr:hypothetical protein MKW98_015855 [Papaver atlanticum]